MSVFIQPFHDEQGVIQSDLNQSKAGLNTKVSLSSCLTKNKESRLPYYLRIAGGEEKDKDSCISQGQSRI